ncbi:hypothetical protein DVH05_023914 [Phytophthora capsici]|nr:hypothetical protein DVH05_023914 [Phytophthora capsici]
MPSRKTKKCAHVSDSDYNSGDDAEDIEGVSVSFSQFSGEFKSWDAFHEELKRKRRKLYKIRSTNSVGDRNKQRRAVALRRGTSPVIFDESPQFYTKTLICTHGWTFQPRGKGARTSHNIRPIDCPAKLNAVLIKEGNENYKVRVTKHVATHNHVIGQDVYYTYTEARKITSPGTQRVVRTMMQGGSKKKKKILRYLKEVSGKVVLPNDVENLIAKMRNETYTSEDDNVRVAQVLQDFSEGPGNAVNVFRDKSTGITTCITFQTAHMRRSDG